MVEIVKVKMRKSFMQSNGETDPLKKREKFAVSLRKKKKQDII
jgi:hypothetical protein